jgi:hypothetical protein
MSSPEETAAEAIESALRAVDASLSVLVVARENLVNALRTISTPAPKDPFETMGPGKLEDPETCEHAGEVLPAGRGRGICDACGKDIPWAG